MLLTPRTCRRSQASVHARVWEVVGTIPVQITSGTLKLVVTAKFAKHDVYKDMGRNLWELSGTLGCSESEKNVPEKGDMPACGLFLLCGNTIKIRISVFDKYKTGSFRLSSRSSPEMHEIFVIGL